MTVHSDGKHDIFESVMHLLSLESAPGKPLFDHVHWQIDALWDSPTLKRLEEFTSWRDNMYNPGITQLTKYFVAELQKGRVAGIAPFLGILNTMMDGKKTKLRCGSGLDSFNVTTAGKITACPIAPEFDELASVEDPAFDAAKLRDSVHIGGEYCPKCDVLDECGGRCLYANKTNWWGDSFPEVCVTVRHLLKEMRAILPVVKDAIAAGKVPREAFNYPPFNNSVEIMP